MADVVSKPLGKFDRYVVASPAYLASRGYPTAPSHLVDHDCLRFSYSVEPQVWTFCQAGETLKIAVTGQLKANNAEVLREAVLDGAGIGLLPDWLVRADVQAGRMTKLFETYEIIPNDARSVITALYLPNQRGSRRVNAFIDFVTTLIEV